MLLSVEKLCKQFCKFARFGHLTHVLKCQICCKSDYKSKGCGKTTVLRLIAGFEQLDQGEIEIGGDVVAGPHHRLPPEQRRIGMVFQDYAIFPHLTVAGNVGFGLNGRASRDDRSGPSPRRRARPG